MPEAPIAALVSLDASQPMRLTSLHAVLHGALALVLLAGLAGCDGMGKEDPENPVTFLATLNGDLWKATAAAEVQGDGAFVVRADRFSDQSDAGAASAQADAVGPGPYVVAQIVVRLDSFEGAGTYALGDSTARYRRLIGGDVLGTTAASTDGTLRITNYDADDQTLTGELEFVGTTDDGEPFRVENGRFETNLRCIAVPHDAASAAGRAGTE